MANRFSKYMEEYLAPVPAPAGLTSREIVRRAIEFNNPPRIPYSFIRPLQSDFFETGYVRPPAASPRREPGEEYYDSWGVGQRVTGRGWDFSFDHPLADLRKLDSYRFPDVAAPERFSRLAPYVKAAQEAGKYVVGGDPVMMFERMRALLGYEALMTAPYDQPEGLEALLDRMTDLEVDIVEQYARVGAVDAFMTWDDFGLQTGLQMRMETFRRFYKPRYARIVEAAHRRGMHYIWHNCGQILAMIPDMIDIGVDVVQIDQPRLMGHQRLAEVGGGKICFWNTIDIQWCTKGGITAEKLRAEVAEMVAAFDRFHGGFIARHYPQPWDIGLSDEDQLVISKAFFDHGCGP